MGLRAGIEAQRDIPASNHGQPGWMGAKTFFRSTFLDQLTNQTCFRRVNKMGHILDLVPPVWLGDG